MKMANLFNLLSIIVVVVVLGSSTSEAAPRVRRRRQLLTQLFPNSFPNLRPIGANVGGGVNVDPLTNLGRQSGYDGLGDFSLGRGGEVDVADLRASGGRKGCFAGVCLGDDNTFGNVDGQGTFGASRNRGVDLSNISPALSFGQENGGGYNPWTGRGTVGKKTSLPFGIGVQQSRGFNAPGLNDFASLFGGRKR